MSQLIDVHEEGEFVFTMGAGGLLRAYRVEHTGVLDEVDVHAATLALATEAVNHLIEPIQIESGCCGGPQTINNYNSSEEPFDPSVPGGSRLAAEARAARRAEESSGD